MFRLWLRCGYGGGVGAHDDRGGREEDVRTDGGE